MYIAGIGHAVLELLSFKVGPGNHQRGIFLLQKFSEIFVNMRLVSPKMTSHLTSHNFQISRIETFSKPFTGILISSNCPRTRFLLKRHKKNVTTFCSRASNNRSVTLKL